MERNHRPTHMFCLPSKKVGTIASELKKGDTVAWKTSQGETTGKVVKKQTSPTKIKGREVKVFKGDP